MLRSIAYEPELFERATRLLVRFAVEDGNGGKSRAAEALTSLFYVHVSGTHATLPQRLRVMESLVRSANASEQDLGLKLLRALLEASSIPFHQDYEFGAQLRDYGYNPTFDEAQVWFASALETADELAKAGLATSARIEALIASAFRGLWSDAEMYEALERLSLEIHGRGYWREGWLAICETLTYENDATDQAARPRLMELERRLRPTNLVQKVRSTVLSPEPTQLVGDGAEWAEDDVETRYNRADALAQRLGGEVAHDEQALRALLPELLKGSERCFRFGCGLGAGSGNAAMCWGILKEGFQALPERDRDTRTMGGFLCGVAPEIQRS
jgi:hypothetical protein